MDTDLSNPELNDFIAGAPKPAEPGDLSDSRNNDFIPDK